MPSSNSYCVCSHHEITHVFGSTGEECGQCHGQCKKFAPEDKCARCGGTRGTLIHKVVLLRSDPWLGGIEDVHEFVPPRISDKAAKPKKA